MHVQGLILRGNQHASDVARNQANVQATEIKEKQRMIESNLYIIADLIHKDSN